MKYRTVGQTGLEVSEIGFGTGGTAGLMVAGDYEDQRRAVARALELGINYFDESPDYGDTVSESSLGRIFADLRARPIVNTKVEIRAENLDDIAGHIERSVEESLERLRVDQVEFVQIHNAPVAQRPDLQGRAYNVLWIEDYLRPGGVLDGLERVVKAGKARFTGFICRGNDAPQVKQLIDTGLFSMVNLVYTLLNPSAAQKVPPTLEIDADFGQVIPYAFSKGVGTAVYSPLAGGLLTDNRVNGGRPHALSRAGREDARGSEDRRQRLLDRVSAFRGLTTSDCSLAQAAVRFILMQPGVTTVLGGFSDVHQVEEIATASELGALDVDAISRIEQAWNSNLATPGT